MDSSLTDHDLARLIIPKLGVLLTSVCQVKAFEGWGSSPLLYTVDPFP